MGSPRLERQHLAAIPAVAGYRPSASVESRVAVRDRVVVPWVGVAAALLSTAAAYAVLASATPAPVVYDDELIYWSAGQSLADRSGLSVRGAEYGYGIAALYPAAIAIVIGAFPDREAAYEFVKLLNALLFASAVVPIFLLARRVLPPWPSVAVGLLSIVIPSSMYVSKVMTESLAYPASAWALLAMMLALERPTIGRQALALLALAVACGVRLQFAVLVAAYVLAQVGLVALVPSRRGGRHTALRALAPSAFVLLLALAVAALLSFVGDRSATEALGGYTRFLADADLAGMPAWVAYQLANLELYVAVVPLAVTPIVVAELARCARAGSERHGALLATFLLANAGSLLLAASFDSTEHALGRLHDRYVFFVVPLWLIVLFWWLHRGAPRPRTTAGLGVVLALVLAMSFPVSQIDARHGGQLFDGIATTPWAMLEATADLGATGLRIALLAFAIVLTSLTLLVPRRLDRFIPVVVLAWLVLSSALTWGLALETSRDEARRVSDDPAEEHAWVDQSVPAGSSVVTLFAPCADGGLARRSLFHTEFFNSTLVGAFHVGRGYGYSLKSKPVGVGAGGLLMRTGAAPLVADYVVTLPGVPVQGRSLRRGTRAQLVLWEVGGRGVRVRGIDSTRGLVSAACRARAAEA